MRVVRKLFRSCLPGDGVVGVGVLADLVVLEVEVVEDAVGLDKRLVRGVEDSSAGGSEMLEEGE